MRDSSCNLLLAAVFRLPLTFVNRRDRADGPTLKTPVKNDGQARRVPLDEEKKTKAGAAGAGDRRRCGTGVGRPGRGSGEDGGFASYLRLSRCAKRNPGKLGPRRQRDRGDGRTACFEQRVRAELVPVRSPHAHLVAVRQPAPARLSSAVGAERRQRSRDGRELFPRQDRLCLYRRSPLVQSGDRLMDFGGSAAEDDAGQRAVDAAGRPRHDRRRLQRDLLGRPERDV